MSFNKENMDFFLPSLINNHKFQELFYHQNKLIVYDSSQLNKNTLLSPKTITMLQRPKTSVSLNKGLTNKLVNARSKASIQKFILTHKKINEQKQNGSMSCVPKRRFNRNMMKKAEASKNQTIPTLEQSLKVDSLIITEQAKQNPVVRSPPISSKNSVVLQPSDKLLKEIAEQSRYSERRSVRSSICEVKSLDRSQRNPDKTQKNLDSVSQTPMSLSREKSTMIYKSKNPYPLRKSISINPKEVRRGSKHNVSSFCINSKRNQSSHQNQPEINQSEKSEKSSSIVTQKQVQNENQNLKKLFNPIYGFFGVKDIYAKSSIKDYLSDALIPQNLGMLPRDCFLSDETAKRKSYFDSELNRLKRKIDEQDDVIKEKSFEIQQLKIHKQQQKKYLESQNNEQNFTDHLKVNEKNIKQQQAAQTTNENAQTDQLTPLSNKVVKSNIIRLSSIQEQQDAKTHNGSPNEDDKKERLLTQEIQSLTNQFITQKSQFFENQSSLTQGKVNEKLQKESTLNGSTSHKFYASNYSSKNSKKIVLKSRLLSKDNFFEIQQSCLKRAKILNFLNKQHYENLIGLYWVLINQKENSLIATRQMENPSEKSIENHESFKYIKDFHKSRSQMIDETNQEQRDDASNTQKQEKIYIDKEFPHESIKIPQKNGQIHWLYFKPCPQSSFFPTDQHYVISEEQSSSIKSLVSLLNTLLNINPDMLERLFEPTYNNVFCCWLNKNNIFQPVHVDGYLPYNGKLNSLYAWCEEFLWVGVMVKCCAKLFGGYEKLLKFTFDDWSQVILGKTLLRLNKPSYKQVQQWEENEFQPKIIDYLAKAQQKHRSLIVVRSKSTKFMYMIAGIKNNKIKLSHIHSQTKRLQMSLFEFMLEDDFELILFPESFNSYHTTSEYESYQKGNIITYQLKVPQHKTSLTLSTQLFSEQHSQEGFTKIKHPEHNKRRILVYEIPFSGKRESKNKKEMVFKHSSDTHAGSKIFTNPEDVQTLQMDLNDLKKGEYKIFIECGKIKLNDYFESHSKSINKWMKTEESVNEKVYPKILLQCQKPNRKFKNILTVISSNQIALKGGKSLIINEKTQENEVIEDDNFRYLPCKTAQIYFDSEF